MTGKRYQAALTPATLMALEADNPVHNGGFDIWQRGSTFTSVATGAYTADRWQYLNTSGAVHDILRSTDVPAVAALVPYTTYSIHLDVTTADASVGAADYCLLHQPLEGYTWAPFAQKQFSIGFWVKDTITGIHCVALRNQGADRSCVMEYTVSVADTWEYKTLTFPASPSAGTWDYTTAQGLFLEFVLICGSTKQTTAGAWQAGNFVSTSSIVNSVSSTSNNFKLWGVTMGLGTTVAPFWPRSFGQELARCQRYYEQIPGVAANDRLAAGHVTSTTIGDFWVPWKVEKRAVASVTCSAAATFSTWSGTGGVIACTVVSPTNITTRHCGISTTVAGGQTGGQGAILLATNTSALIAVSADL